MMLQNAFNNGTFEALFNISTNGHDYHWIQFDVRVKVDRDVFLYFVSVKEAEERYVIMQQRLDAEAELQSERVQTFDIDLTNGKAYLGQDMQLFYGYPAVLDKLPETFLQDDMIHPDDKRILSSIMVDLLSGKPHCEFELRVKNPRTGTYFWRQVRFTVIFDDDNRPVRALTVVEDVNATKLQQDHFRGVLQLCGVATWDYYIDRHYIANGTRMNELFGVSDTLVTNVPDSIISCGMVHKDDIPVYLDIHKRLENGDLNPECELRFFNVVFQTYMWYRLRYSIIPSENGESFYAIGNATDINDLKIAELNYENEVRTLSEIQGENLIEKALINITRNSVKSFISFRGADEDSKIISENYVEGLMNVMDICSSEEFGEKIWRSMNPEALMNSFKNGKKDITVEYKRQMPNNYYEWVVTKINIYEDPKTNDLMCFLYTYDINRKKMKQEAMEIIGTEDYDYINIIDVISGRAFTIHKKGVWNHFDQFDGVDFDQFFQKYAEKIHPYLDSEDDYKTIVEKFNISSLTIQLNYCPKVDYIIRQHDGESGSPVVRRTVFRYLDEECTSILSCTSDITEMMKTETERELVLKNALSQATKANKAKTNFLAKMSHDIRTPLNGIMGMTQIALQETDVAVMHEYLKKIDTSSQFLLEILNDILDMSKIENGVVDIAREPYSISEFKAHIESVIMPLVENKNQNLKLSFPKNIVFYTDRQKFNQIFFNILSNSVKFTEAGGKISFTILRRYFSSKKENFEFIIEDNGCGISEDFQEHMFEEFTQENKDTMTLFNGTGLGLAIVKSLVERMDGEIKVESLTGKKHGTKVTVKLKVEI